jgi:ParB family chromosome partitioning protein
MSSKHKKLGSLAEIYQSEHLDGSITRLRLDRIRPSEDQPRRDASLNIDELAISLEKEGLLAPIVVTRAEEGAYRIIAGERRYRAARKLGWTEIECRIISREERDHWRIAIIENLQRENLQPDEEAQALLKLKRQENLSDSDLAAQVGKSRNYITEILGIAGLEAAILERCKAAGIQSRNLLIQAVQAYKKNTLDEFIQAFQTGAISTVREARDYLKKDKAGQAAPPPGRKRPAVSITRKKNQLTLTCSDEAQARQLELRLLKQFS